ncbi:hypothetical protein FGADI_561 [Fusarium gaditjirri]|uniref:Uncharacterized protein n=1 Tax=Fusarium gaditjirri TaxID=282569 RepID=A0A8H4TN12_9HYPO|nr:hypothetical protein FGADI_561 [Fusarium gaditjirri]
MLVRGYNALRGSQALFRLPSLARYSHKMKGELEQEQIQMAMEKPKKKQTTRPWASGIRAPRPKAARPIPADPNSKCTVVKIPNASAAFQRWPTLYNFKPALQPRTVGTIRPGARSGVQATVDTSMELAILPYLYNDLGVLIFEGPDRAQVEIMSNILRSVECEECRLPERDWTTGGTSFEVNYDKWSVYRIKLNPSKHLKKKFQKGGKKRNITPNGLHDLTNIALEKWKADGIEGPVRIRTMPGPMNMYIVDHVGGPGLENITINGPYLPQLHVYVATGFRDNTIYMCIEFHTVGTRRLVGVTYLQLTPTVEISSNKDTAEEPPQGVDRNTDFDQKFASARSQKVPRELYEKLVPSNTRRNSEIHREAMRKVYKLESELWAQRKKINKQKRQDELRAKKVAYEKEKARRAMAKNRRKVFRR